MPIDAELVRKSFALVEPYVEGATAYFYGLLFAENPQLRELFPLVMDVQRDRLFLGLAHVAAHPEPSALLEQLGRDHRKYGVQPEHYTAVGRALLATVRRFAATSWDDAIEAAWVAAYTRAANTMIEAAARDEAPAWWPAEVVAHELRAADIAVIRLRPAGRVPYTAGQYLSVGTPRRPRVWRSFSPANAPRADGTVDLHVRAIPGGLVSTALVRHTKPGDELTLGPAVGAMTPPDSDRDLICVAGGTGLAPLKAIVEHIVDSGRRPAVHLVAGARTTERLYDLPDLLALSSRYPRLRLVQLVADRITPDALPRWDGQEVYVCGPAAMVEQTVRGLLDAGVPPERIHHDQPRRSDTSSR
ncbi:FAD-binding oxidoreductase [Nonomuraea sp. NPDC050556]|uniref:FAD-binding oxidoreductase n=1 Tax=Nonomuraea sp. NPDC050556 TaxID=3364369 RepID=UPI0037B844C1